MEINPPAETTSKQEGVLKFLRAFITKNGYAPTSREIQDHFGFASQTAAINHLNALERKGRIKRVAGRARTITIL